MHFGLFVNLEADNGGMGTYGRDVMVFHKIAGPLLSKKFIHFNFNFWLLTASMLYVIK